jgi:hypothetical protein|tara:strand:- start:380 stop:484 length:105 start_codon:yes stop_codon:yes gene_type:complete
MNLKVLLEIAIIGIAEYRAPAWVQSPRRAANINR